MHIAGEDQCLAALILLAPQSGVVQQPHDETGPLPLMGLGPPVILEIVGQLLFLLL